MGRRALALGERGEIETTPQVRVTGKWVRTDRPRTAERHRARVYFRDWDGVRREINATGRNKALATKACEALLAERLRASDGAITSSTPLTSAGELWLGQIGRTDSGLSERTVIDYSRAFHRCIDADRSTLRGLTLLQANDPQRLRSFLQGVADQRGTGTAKICRSILTGILGFAVDNGTLASNAMRQVRLVRSQVTKVDGRDRDRALSRDERDAIIGYADAVAAGLSVNPRTVRKRRTTADLMAFMAGTGVRIEEARCMRWEHVNLTTGATEVRGTKSETSDRRITLPKWLRGRLQRRADELGSEGLLFPAPAHLDDPERPWDQANSAKAVRSVLDGAGFPWAVPHTFRRTVATLLHEAGVPLAEIADQLGHTDPAMTARVYLGRDYGGHKASLAEHL